jgi:AraC-like DNA-binding protein
MSRIRQRTALTVEQEPFLTVRSWAANLTSGHVIETHSHKWHQLVCGYTGAMTVWVGRSSWIIPPGKAVLIPAGGVHSIRMWGQVEAKSLYFPGSLRAAVLGGGECRVLTVSPLLRELILRVIELGALDGRITEHQNLLRVLLDEMSATPVTPLSLPLPADVRAMAVARHILAAPSCEDSFDDLARRYGASRRTLERLFRSETGLSFGLWRQKARLLDSMRLLSEGKSVTDAAMDSGYESLSAFIAAFKKTFGYTPGRLGQAAL